MSVLFYLGCPDSVFSCWGPWPSLPNCATNSQQSERESLQRNSRKNVSFLGKSELKGGLPFHPALNGVMWGDVSGMFWLCKHGWETCKNADPEPWHGWGDKQTLEPPTFRLCEIIQCYSHFHLELEISQLIPRATDLRLSGMEYQERLPRGGDSLLFPSSSGRMVLICALAKRQMMTLYRLTIFQSHFWTG